MGIIGFGDGNTPILSGPFDPHFHVKSDVTDLTTDLAAKAPLDNPTFTGTTTADALAVSDDGAGVSFKSADGTDFELTVSDAGAAVVTPL